jgi:hypothetical protein
MLHAMSKERGWSHDEMMRMSKRVFFRYYGYWYAEEFNEVLQYEWDQAKNKAKNEINERR